MDTFHSRSNCNVTSLIRTGEELAAVSSSPSPSNVYFDYLSLGQLRLLTIIFLKKDTILYPKENEITVCQVSLKKSGLEMTFSRPVESIRA